MRAGPRRRCDAMQAPAMRSHRAEPRRTAARRRLPSSWRQCRTGSRFRSVRTHFAAKRQADSFGDILVMIARPHFCCHPADILVIGPQDSNGSRTCQQTTTRESNTRRDGRPRTYLRLWDGRPRTYLRVSGIMPICDGRSRTYCDVLRCSTWCTSGRYLTFYKLHPDYLVVITA